MQNLVQRSIRATQTIARSTTLASIAFFGSSAHTKVIPDTGQIEPAVLQCPALRVSTSKPPAPTPQRNPNQGAHSEAGDAFTPFLSNAPDTSSVKPIPGLQKGTFLRMALWGDSHSAANFLSEGLIHGLGLSGSDVQPSFIPASFGMPGVRLPIRKSCVGPGWAYSLAYRAKERNSVYPTSLISAKTNENDSYLWLDFRTPNHAEGLPALDMKLSAPNTPDSATGVMAVSVNDAPEKIIAVDPSTDRLLEFRPERGVKTLRIRLISGELALDGLVPHFRQKPKLVLDTFGIPGATVRGWEMIDLATLRENSTENNYDVVLLAYGTNEGNDADYDESKYATKLRSALKNMRSVYPLATCVLIGPADRGVTQRRVVVNKKLIRVQSVQPYHYSDIHRSITQTQKRIGNEFGCQLWDWQSAMGGPGGANNWSSQNPPLMARDLIHLTPQGYRLSGQYLGERLSGK